MAVKNWLELKSVRDIQIFIGFANFYHHFIKGFSKIAASLTSILKITNSALKALGADDIVGGMNEMVKDLSKSKKSKNTKSENQICIEATGEPTFLTLVAREAFNQLKQAFTKAPIF